MTVAWKPLPKQSIALKRTENEILFGGARGGGKTDCGQAWLLYDIDKPYYRALVIRRNATDLDDWKDRARSMYSYAGGKLVGDTFVFPSGARIRTGHLKDDNAYAKYQGHEYHKILIEELTHIARESDYEKLKASNRSKHKDIKPQIFGTTNPDGPGHEWVKDRWAIPDIPSDDLYLSDEGGIKRAFIPSKMDDNPILLEADPDYVKNIESIKDEELRRAWRDGSWEGFGVEGSYYKNFLDKAREDGRITTGLFDPSQPVYTWCDLGKGENYSIGFFQKRWNSWALIEYKELQDDQGLHEGIKYLKSRDYIYAEHYAPHDIDVKDFSATQSRKELAENMGITFNVLARSSVHEGIDTVKFKFAQLWFDEGRPGVGLFIKRIRRYHKEFDDKRGIWKQNPVHDENSHAADMLRYWAVTKVYDTDQAQLGRVMQNRSRNRNLS